MTSLTSSASAVTVPDSFTLTATLDRDVGPTPYSVAIIDDDTGSSVGGCGSGTSCTVTVGTSYSADNANPRTRHFHAEVTGSGGPYGPSGQVSVEIRRFNFDVSLASDKSAVTVPDSFTLTATLDRDVGPTPYSVQIVDDDTGSSVGGCSSGTTCRVTVGSSYSDDNANPRTRHFHAEVVGSGGPYGRSGQVGVAIERFDFDVSLASDRSAVTVPDSFTLTATLDRDVGPTPYSVQIVDDDTGSSVGGCGSGTTCQITIGTSWNPDNANPRTRRFHAEVVGSGGPFGRSGQVGVEIRRFIFLVDLAITGQRTDEQGRTFYDLRATSNRDVGPTPSSIQIRNSQGNSVGGCGGGTVCDVANVPADTYRASVEGGGLVFGSSSVDGVDLTALAALFATAADVCTELAMMPGSHVERSTLNDAAIECEKARLAGLSPQDTLARIAAIAGGTLVAWLNFTGALDDGTFPPPPVPGDPPTPPYRPQPPETLPRTWDAPIASTAATIRTRNPAAELTDAQASAIARQCLWLAAQAELGYGPCSRDKLPIFVTGGNVMEATKHDLEAIAGPQGRPGWMKLNYDGVPKSRNWLATDLRCAELTGADTGMHCDEYPFNKVEQGGQPGDPSLKPIPVSDNTSQGESFGAGVTRCAMRPAQSSSVRGDAFLVVPVPVAAVPTAFLCNGKSADSQPPQPPATGG